MCCGGKMKDHHDGGNDCCFGHEVVKDRVCCKFTLTNPATEGTGNRINQDIYVNNTGQCIVASGTVSLGCALAPGVVAAVRFFRGDTQIGGDTLIREESCVTFTASGFTRINIITFLPPGGKVSGQICVTPRYQLHV